MTPEQTKQRSVKALEAKKAKAEQKKRGISYLTLERAKEKATELIHRFEPPKLFEGVVPQGVQPAVAMDSQAYSYANDYYMASDFQPFVGYQVLASYATRPEYRTMAVTLATEMTRRFIEIKGKDDKNEAIKEKISQIEDEFHRLDVKRVLAQAIEHDAYFGRGQIFITLKGQDPDKPMILDPRTIPVGSLERITAVEPMWLTPVAYSSTDPTAPDFYRPHRWYMLGKQVHASRLMSIVTRPLPDMLKPAYNMSGVSLSQLAHPYVENWLRTRQSVSDMVNNFSITALQTDMSQILQGGDDGSNLLKRAELFTALRSNKGLMLLDKEIEELVQINTPLSGLDALQAQALEQLCVVSRIPAVVLTGLSPSGLNASSEGEMQAFWSWIGAQQENHLRPVVETLLKVVQLSLFGKIDTSIVFEFKPLQILNDHELSEMRKANADEAAILIDRGVIDAAEVREKIARDPSSGWNGLDLNKVIEMPEPDVPPFADQNEGFDPTGEAGEPKPEPQQKGNAPETEPKIGQDAEFKEADHPRAENGQFGSGGGSSSKESGASSGGGSVESLPQSVQDDIATAIFTKDAYGNETPYMDAWEESGRDIDDFDEKNVLKAIKDSGFNGLEITTANPSEIFNQGRKVSGQFVERYKEQLSKSEAPPILVKDRPDGGLEIVEGGHRLKASQLAGAKSIRVVNVTELLNASPKELFKQK